ncbi:MAG: TetR/AcrR family transcriptional regulator [Bdellovibrionota bacterium]
MRARRTQEERSAATQEILLDATIETLIEKGYAGTTTTEVAKRARVSRGAQLHHFPMKAQLVIRAVEHLAGRRGEELRREAEQILPRAADRIGAAIDLLWSSFSGKLFQAALELWVAARTDKDLREHLLPVERRMGGQLRGLSRYLLGIAPDLPPDLEERTEIAVDSTLHLLRGMTLAGLFARDEARQEKILATWKELLGKILRDQGTTPAESI